MEVRFKPAGCVLKFLDDLFAVWFRIRPSYAGFLYARVLMLHDHGFYQADSTL